MGEYIGVVGGERLELVVCTRERKPGEIGHAPGKGRGEFGLRVEAGADSRATLGQWIKLMQRHLEPTDAALDLRGIAGKLLSQGQRCCVLGMGAADLHDAGER